MLVFTAVTLLSTPLVRIVNAGTVNISSEYVVFAWNDLGMHCLNPSYDKAVILPPYNDLFAQVVRRGATPQVVTSGITVEYRVINNTYSSGKKDFGQFWQYSQKLFGGTPPVDKGLNLVDPDVHNGLSGKMLAKGDHFVADGIPVVPIDDAGVWNPYQVAEITVKDSTGKVIAQTRTTIPTSDEINCAKCHGTDPFTDILRKHDQMHGTTLEADAPVLCSGCHASPVLKTVAQGGAKGYLSAAIHGSHANRGATCYDCHPGTKTKCSRSNAHTNDAGNCEKCHGGMATVASSITSGGRVPWVDEPKCSTCHTGVAQVDSGNVLFRNAQGHGGMFCSACHGSPHAMVPAREASDNYQAMQYQGAAKTIGSCGACHSDSRGEGLGEFLGEHGGSNPQRQSACNVCHTSVSTTSTSMWPHNYQWGSTAGGGGTGSTVSAVSISASSSSVTAGSPVTFSAAASGGSGSYQYSFRLSGPGTSGQVVKQAYSSSNQWAWTPSAADVGANTVTVWARNAGSTDTYQATNSMQVTVTAAQTVQPVKMVSLTSTPSSPVRVGTTVTWKGAASGGTGRYEFRFLVYNGSWKTVRDWASSSTYYWTPTRSGNYQIMCQVRAAGSEGSYADSIKSPVYSVTRSTSR